MKNFFYFLFIFVLWALLDITLVHLFNFGEFDGEMDAIMAFAYCYFTLKEKDAK